MRYAFCLAAATLAAVSALPAAAARAASFPVTGTIVYRYDCKTKTNADCAAVVKPSDIVVTIRKPGRSTQRPRTLRAVAGEKGSYAFRLTLPVGTYIAEARAAKHGLVSKPIALSEKGLASSPLLWLTRVSTSSRALRPSAAFPTSAGGSGAAAGGGSNAQPAEGAGGGGVGGGGAGAGAAAGGAAAGGAAAGDAARGAGAAGGGAAASGAAAGGGGAAAGGGGGSSTPAGSPVVAVTIDPLAEWNGSAYDAFLTISWRSTHATACQVETTAGSRDADFLRAPDGSFRIGPIDPREYPAVTATVRCRGTAGAVETSTATVDVSALIPARTAVTPPRIDVREARAQTRYSPSGDSLFWSIYLSYSAHWATSCVVTTDVADGTLYTYSPGTEAAGWYAPLPAAVLPIVAMTIRCSGHDGEDVWSQPFEAPLPT